MNYSIKTILWGVAILMTLILSTLAIGINDAGHRTVVQYPNGTLSVEFDPGVYMQWFGSIKVYNDVITFDFDETVNGEGSTLDQPGISVRYQDGGQGTVFGIARFRLPSTTQDMLKVHKEFRSNEGIAYKIIKTTTAEIANHTAGLMTSEESYAEKRGTYTQYFKTQLNNGKFATVQKEIITTEAGFEFCLEKILTAALKKECKDVKKTTKQIPVIAQIKGIPQHVEDDFDQYGISVSGFNLVDWGYEDKTLKQISAKREATMAIITSKANAERAKQDAITAEQQGLANVKVAQYEKEVEKERAVVDAERVAEVAVINAKQLVDVAAQQKLEQEQLKLAAYEEKKKLIAQGQGEAEKKRLIMVADGALEQKLAAWVKVNDAYARNFAKQKWVSEIQMGGANGTSGSAAADMIQLLSTQAAKQLSLDMSMKTSK